MTEQELDRIIVYLIPQATRRQTEVLMGQLNVHKELLEMREDVSLESRLRGDISAFVPDDEGDGFEEHTEAMEQSRLRAIMDSAAGRRSSNNPDNEWSGG